MTRFEVYLHTSPSGKSYVGYSSRGMVRRWRAHVVETRRGSCAPFHAAIRKHGPDAFTHELIEVMTTEAGAKRAEQLWIERLGTAKNTGYNATTGGEGCAGRVHSAETRAKIAAGNSGPRPAWIGRLISAALTGKKRGPRPREVVARCAAAHVGRKRSEETRARIADAMRKSHARKAGAK